MKTCHNKWLDGCFLNLGSPEVENLLLFHFIKFKFYYLLSFGTSTCLTGHLYQNETHFTYISLLVINIDTVRAAKGKIYEFPLLFMARLNIRCC